MINSISKNIIISFFVVLLLSAGVMQGRIKEPNSKDQNSDEIQRTPLRVFDLQKNTVSNLEFHTTNWGIFGLNTERGEGSGYWPRGSQNQYIFGGGFWFAAIKKRPDLDVKKKYVVLSYNPNSGKSWFVPGRIDDGPDLNQSDIYKYRTYFSTDMIVSDGSPIDKADGPNWPIWDSSPDPKDTLKSNRYFGYYINDVNDRNKTKYPKGPAFISGEDIFSTYKDTDLNYIEGGRSRRKNEGYPLQLQVEQMIYSWGFGDYKDFIFIKYDIINYSNDTLESCWLATVMDIDIARRGNVNLGARNDRVRFFEENPSLNLAFQWTNPDQGEAGRGFGYLGFVFLESPAVNKFYDTLIVRDNEGNPIDTVYREVIKPETNFLRKDSSFYAHSSQLGLVTFRNWPIDIDPQGDEERYDFMALGQREGDTGPGDKRFLMATGPFNMRPRDTARTVVGVILANTASGADATGKTEDVALLIARTHFAQKVYDNNFQAPSPPLRAIFVNPDDRDRKPATQPFKPLNNAIMVAWDSTAEISTDVNERGLDFMGYRLYRARRSNLDTFNVDRITPGGEYTKGAGPFGWRQVAQWQIPTPFEKSVHTAGYRENELTNMYIDSLKVVGLVQDPNNWITGLDEFAVKVMNLGRGVVILPDSLAQNYNFNTTPNPRLKDAVVSPVVALIDTALFAEPWGKYYAQLAGGLEFPVKTYPNPPKHFLFDNVLIGTIYLNRANLDYNPLYYKRRTVRVVKDYNNQLPANGIFSRDVVNPDDTTKFIKVIDSVYKPESYRWETVNNASTYYMDVLYPRHRDSILNDREHITEFLDSLYMFIKKGFIAKYDLPDFAGSEKAKNDVILPYFKRITTNRTYLDIGDTDRDAVITYNADPTKTEKIINNVDYYYMLLSYDEGDFLQPTGTKLNDASEGTTNFTKTYSFASPVQNEPTFEITHIDSNMIGGLYNFRFYSLNNDRVRELFAGHEFELEFQPAWSLSRVYMNYDSIQYRKEMDISLYRRLITLKDLTSGEDLFGAYTYFEVEPCNIYYRGAFTENAASFLLYDKPIFDPVKQEYITFGTPFDKGLFQRSGTISTGNFTTPGYCYSYGFAPKAYGTLGFSFDYSMVQFGGLYRPDSTTARIKGDAVTPISFIADPDEKPFNVYTTMPVDSQRVRQGYANFNFFPIYGSFNNGPAHYLVDFEFGGTETMELQWGQNYENRNTFNVSYLVPKLHNIIKFNRPKENNPFDSVEVTYPNRIEHMELPLIRDGEAYYPNPKSLKKESNKFINKYNLAAHGYINSRNDNRTVFIRRQAAKPVSMTDADIRFPSIGTQGRYYLSALSVDGKDTLDFVHILWASGVQFVFDYANKARRKSINVEWGEGGFTVPREQYNYGPDFKSGDQVLLKTFGGALGLPLPGAKVRFKIPETQVEEKNITNEMMDKITVVPNPYYITHQAQKSPYDTKMIYFTRLPKRCTISIYTLTGDLIQTIEHDEINSPAPDKAGVDAWDLLSTNNQRVQSQMMIAIIRTPDGAETVKKFTVVVGSARLIQD